MALFVPIALFQTPDDLDIELANLLSKSVSVDTQQVRGLDLISARGRQTHAEKRPLHLLQQTVV